MDKSKDRKANPDQSEGSTTQTERDTVRETERTSESSSSSDPSDSRSSRDTVDNGARSGDAKK